MTVHNHGTTEEGPGLACVERRIDGRLIGCCITCRCGHPLGKHYRDLDDEGCVECNKARLQSRFRYGKAELCPGFREVVASAHADGA